MRQLVQAHAYWRLKGLAVDLVIWNEDRAGYRQLLQDQIMGLIAAGVEAHVMDRPGGIFVRRAEQISDEDRMLLQSVARAIITDRRGTLAEQINPPHPRGSAGSAPQADPDPPRATGHGRVAAPRSAVLQRARRIHPRRARVRDHDHARRRQRRRRGSTCSRIRISEPSFPKAALAYTWSENAHEFRLTPWHNDPVTDASGEAFYLRDEESGHFWSPAPLPSRGATPYVTRHGFGYSVFEHAEDGIVSELCVYVALDAAIKFSVLKVRNDSGRPRRLSATGYVEWVLGDLRPKTAMHVITEIDPTSGALCARNAYNTSSPTASRSSMSTMPTRTVTGDRTEFLGRNGTLKNPAAMARSRLSNRVGAALDPCAAMQVPFELADGQEREIVFRLGVAGRRGADDAASLVQRFRGSTAARDALEAVRQYWKRHARRACRSKRPIPPLNVLANGWLVYQTLACRLWARSGYYQSGGAFGFRDQLQDAMALVHAEPRAPARAPAALRGPSVPRRRRPALVASAVGPRRAHALLGRLPLAAAGDVPLCAGHRGHRRAR